MWTRDLTRRPRTLRRGTLLALPALLVTGLLAGVTAPTANAVGPLDGGSTVVTVVGANGVGQKDLPLGLAAYSNLITDMSAGEDHALALDDVGRLYAWGDNSEGEGFVYVPQQKAGYRAVSAGTNYSLAINGSGQVEAWGSDRFGLTSPPDSLQGRTVTAISAGASVALALDSTGQVHAWGDFSLGQRDIPQELFSKTVVKIAAGGAFAVAVTEDKQVFAWGHGLFGQTAVPASVQGRTIEEIDAGAAHTVALLNDGTIVSWGDNSQGQLITPTTSTRWHHVSAGSGFTVASGNNDSTIKVWGWGASTTFSNLPPTGGPVARVTAGGDFVAYGRALLRTAEPPVITGSARVGEPLTATYGTWGPRQPTQVVGQWYTADKNVGQGTSFTPTSDLVGKKLYFASIGKRDGFDVSYLPTDVTVRPGLMTKQQAQPTVTGFAQVGKVLTATTSFSPTPDRIQYDWHVDGKFKQATDDGRYTVQPEDLGGRVTVHATAFKSGYDQAASGFSEATASVTVTPRLSVVSAPQVSGPVRVGRAVRVVPPSSEPAATSISYQWMRDGEPIVGASGDTYVPTPQDRGAPLWVQSTLERDGYDGATSPSPEVLVEAGEFTNVGVSSITGKAVVGGLLEAKPPTTDLPGTATYQWLSAGKVIGGATAQAFRARPDDIGRQLSVVVTVQRPGWTAATSTSVPTAPVKKATPVVKAKARTKAGRTVLKVRASAPGLPALSTRMTVRVGNQMVRGKLVAGRAVLKLPWSTKPLKVTLAATVTTSAVTVKVKGAR